MLVQNDIDKIKKAAEDLKEKMVDINNVKIIIRDSKNKNKNNEVLDATKKTKRTAEDLKKSVQIKLENEKKLHHGTPAKWKFEHKIL